MSSRLLAASSFFRTAFSGLRASGLRASGLRGSSLRACSLRDGVIRITASFFELLSQASGKFFSQIIAVYYFSHPNSSFNVSTSRGKRWNLVFCRLGILLSLTAALSLPVLSYGCRWTKQSTDAGPSAESRKSSINRLSAYALMYRSNRWSEVPNSVRSKLDHPKAPGRRREGKEAAHKETAAEHATNVEMKLPLPEEQPQSASVSETREETAKNAGPQAAAQAPIEPTVKVMRESPAQESENNSAQASVNAENETAEARGILGDTSEAAALSERSADGSIQERQPAPKTAVRVASPETVKPPEGIAAATVQDPKVSASAIAPSAVMPGLHEATSTPKAPETLEVVPPAPEGRELAAKDIPQSIPTPALASPEPEEHPGPRGMLAKGTSTTVPDVHVSVQPPAQTPGKLTKDESPASAKDDTIVFAAIVIGFLLVLWIRLHYDFYRP